ncbi:MAG: leucine-rich repeat protein [Oscillospiraceae bacterium]|nr:leucine-rich repeat protein [Oscillospiraceae bacterium]
MKRNPKRTLLAWLLTAAMLLSLLPAAAFAASSETEGVESAAAEQTEELTSETVSGQGYQLADDSETATSGTCGDNLTWTLEDGVLTISGTGTMDQYTDVYDSETETWSTSAPWGSDTVTSVVVEEGVTGIGSYAFYDCADLASVTLPSSVTTIGDWAFTGCTALTEVTIPDGIETIGERAFGSTGLTSVVIPDSVTTIEQDAFYVCTSLTDVTIGNGVLTIGGEAFGYCTSLSEITFLGDVPQVDETYMYLGIGSSEDVTAEFSAYVFDRVTATAYYPADSANFSAESVKNYGDGITWVACGGTHTHTHSYTAAFAWAADCSSATATLTCAGGDDTQTVTATVTGQVTKAATCTETGTMVYTATATYDGVTYAEDQTVTISATGHTWDAGTVTLEATRYTEGIMTYTCTVCGATKTKAIAVLTGSDAEFLFSDVTGTSDYYYTAVYWAYDRGITAGTSTTTFSPSSSCTRAQFVTFLWRMAGEPEPESADNPFTDVPSDQYYYDAVLWAYENKITAGTSTTTFTPNQPVNRAQAVTFLYRYKGSPAVSGSNSFTDVPSGQYYADAIQWAVANGITAGTSDTKFSPSSDCIRTQAVTFLYRYEVEPLTTA